MILRRRNRFIPRTKNRIIFEQMRECMWICEIVDPDKFNIFTIPTNFENRSTNTTKSINSDTKHRGRGFKLNLFYHKQKNKTDHWVLFSPLLLCYFLLATYYSFKY